MILRQKAVEIEEKKVYNDIVKIVGGAL